MPLVTDNYGQMPDIEKLALVVSSTSATMVVEMVGHDGRSLTVPKTLTVTSTAQSVYTILASASVTWDEAFAGMKILSVATADVFYNYGATLTRAVKGNGQYAYTAAVAVAPTTSSLKIAVGDYSAAPYLAGRVAG